MSDESVKIVYLIFIIICTMGIYIIVFIDGLIFGIDKEREERINNETDN